MNSICSAGGPLLLMEERAIQTWGGAIDSLPIGISEGGLSPSGRPTDYDRACRVAGYLGQIPVGGLQALVLWGRPMETIWVPPGPTQGGMLARWMFGETEADFLRWLVLIPDAIFRTEFLFSVETSRLILFDSAVAGRNLKKSEGEYLLIELEPRTYEIKTAVYRPDARTSMVVHRFEPRRSGELVGRPFTTETKERRMP